MMDTTEVVEVKNAETPEQTRGTIFDEMRRDLAEWMTTNRDMVWRPAIELTREDNEFAAKTLVPGVDPKEVAVLVAPERLLIKGEIHRGRPDERKLMCSVAFPRPVEPNKVHAEIRDGVLSVRAKIAGTSKVRIFMPRAA